jgi:hypothetical protein
MTRQNVDLPREPLPLPAASPVPEPREGANADWAPADYIRLLNINTAKVRAPYRFQCVTFEFEAYREKITGFPALLFLLLLLVYPFNPSSIYFCRFRF